MQFQDTTIRYPPTVYRQCSTRQDNEFNAVLYKTIRCNTHQLLTDKTETVKKNRGWEFKVAVTSRFHITLYFSPKVSVHNKVQHSSPVTRTSEQRVNLRWSVYVYTYVSEQTLNCKIQL